MDVVTENEVLTEAVVTKPFPDNEYKKDGSLKKLRGRMLKKLLKYELCAIAPLMGIMFAILLAVSVFVCVFFKVNASMDDAILDVLPIMLYLYALLGTALVAVVVPLNRFEKTLFKNEGYLTLSVPANAEEHLFAKHLVAVCGLLLALIMDIISASVVLNVLDFGLEGSITPTVSGVSAVFACIEAVILVVLICTALFTASGALSCFGQRFSKKGPMIWMGVGIYVLLSTFFNIGGWMSGKGWLDFFNTPVGEHVGVCIWIVVMAGINVFSIWYELRYLKKKINLK